jgi:predicted TIM-barrel fold metal-dependent hydrolase
MRPLHDLIPPAALCSLVIAASAMAAQPPGTSSAAGRSLQEDPAWLEARYGAWGGPGVNPAPGPMDSMLLKDYAPASSVRVPETMVARAKFPAIDVHTHANNARNPEEVAAWVRTMDEVGIELSVVLTGATGEAFDKLVDLYLKKYPTRFQLYCGVLNTDPDHPDFPLRAAAELERCYRMGARGVGELSDKGWGYGAMRAPRAKRLHPDDPRLDPFFRKCAELKIPVNLHSSDHPSNWKPLDVHQERTPAYQHFNQVGQDVPSYEEILAFRDRALARHPQTTFIACHLGNQGNDLATLGRVLDRFPNLYLDLSARDYEVGRAPRAAVKFLNRYGDRVLFGTDMGREKRMYQAWWRLLESADEYMPGRVWWPYYGLELSEPLLEKLYRGNARRVMNWERI